MIVLYKYRRVEREIGMTILELKKAERDVELNFIKNVKDEISRKRCFIAELSKKVLDKYMYFDDIVSDNTYSVYETEVDKYYQAMR